MGVNGLQQRIDDGASFSFQQLELGRGSHADAQPAEAIVTHDLHGLRRLLLRA